MEFVMGVAVGLSLAFFGTLAAVLLLSNRKER